ncbi:MAG: substrate-binding domain-containing protein [Spirochaetia bacterium]|nr:substrate-binding domain-containing protein [Spirochaetia bacterium]
MKKILLFILIIYSFCLASASAEDQSQKRLIKQSRLKLATTTSTENTGLLDTLLPAFTAKTGIVVDVIAVGTGKAITLGENGDVDVIMVHARSMEDSFVAEGYGVNRRDLMHNDFVILGPVSDPAGIKRTNNAAEALRMISTDKSDFISRGDNSGTNVKEIELWEAAGITPTGSWYKEAGQGMGAVITMTNDLQGYTLSDRGTYLSMQDKIDLVVLGEGDPILFNPYGVIAVNPATHDFINYDGAMRLISFVTSIEGQSIIKIFQKNGEQLFYPDAIK